MALCCLVWMSCSQWCEFLVLVIPSGANRSSVHRSSGRICSRGCSSSQTRTRLIATISVFVLHQSSGKLCVYLCFCALLPAHHLLHVLAGRTHSSSEFCVRFEVSRDVARFPVLQNSSHTISITKRTRKACRRILLHL